MRNVVGNVLVLVLLTGCLTEPGDESASTGGGGGAGVSTGGGGSTGGGPTGGGSTGGGSTGGGSTGGGSTGGGSTGGGSTGGGTGQGGGVRFGISPGYPGSIKRDARGVLHAVVADDPLTGLRYLRCGGSCDELSNWKSIVLAPPGVRGPSMAVTPEGKVAVVWEERVGTTVAVVYAECTAADCARLDAWSAPVPVAQRLDLRAPGNHSLAFDDAGALHLVLGVIGGTTNQAYFNCSAACSQTASWVGTTFLSSEACTSASLAVAGAKIGVACVSSISTGRGLIYAECEEKCTSSAYWRWTKPMAQSVSGVSLAFVGAAPRFAYVDADGKPHFNACESNCGFSTSWKGVMWSTLSTMESDPIFLHAEASGMVRLAVTDMELVTLLSCDQSCADASGSHWTSLVVDTDVLAEEETSSPVCPPAYPEKWKSSFFHGYPSFVTDGKDLHLLERASDIKGCNGTDEYTHEGNGRARYVHLRLP